jgi:hypothetical protein
MTVLDAHNKENTVVPLNTASRIIGFFGLFPSSSILENTKHDVSETGFVSILR